MNTPRRRLYVDKDVQRVLVWQLFRHWSLFVAILTGFLFALQVLNHGPNQPWSVYLRAAWDQHSMLFVVVIALFPVFAYDSIKLSHRFVGPIMRLRRALRAVAAGERVPPLQFRKEDFWQDIAESFNTLLERLPQNRTGDSEPDEAAAHEDPELVMAGTAAGGVESPRSQPCK